MTATLHGVPLQRSHHLMCAAPLLRDNKGEEVALAVARGLYFMHQNGVVHRHEATNSQRGSHSTLVEFWLLHLFAEYIA